MKKRVCHPKICACIFLSLTSSALVAQSEATFREYSKFLSVSIVGSKEPDARNNTPTHIVNFGRMSPGQSRAVELNIHNIGSIPVQLKGIATGDRLDWKWKSAASKGNGTSQIVPGGAARLELTFSPDQENQTLQSLILASGSVPVLNLVVDYTVHPPEVVFDFTTQPLTSGLGKLFGPAYLVAAGPAPFGYTLKDHKFESFGSERSCFQFVECHDTKADDNDVVSSFSIQGREHDNTHATDSTMEAVGHLRVVYSLIQSPPKLDEK